MRNYTLSLLTIVALGQTLYAGGDIAPITTPVIEEPTAIEESSPFYIGLGIGRATLQDEITDEEMRSNTLTLQAGYQYNQYIALEGRYAFGFDTQYSVGNTNNQESDYDGDLSSWGIYLKPTYPIGDLNIYALLGYGGAMLDNLVSGDAYEDSFQWGAGMSYEIVDNLSIFVDYISLYDSKGFDYRAKNDDINANIWTLGVTYRF
ncbi:putative outer membrane protein A [hydrothermal vent metagenome]|uniref:Putative outer membrane protein A n=1 Tax=hydrothermal vent metagenome TaxID=652676 RepID=A0A1W1BC56_9ZZZZ